MLWSRSTRVLIDCGLRTQAECRELLEQTLRAGASAGDPSRIDAVVISHAHGDHIGYPALRALAKLGVRIYSHGHVVEHLRERFEYDALDHPPDVRVFASDGFAIGDLHLNPISVPHAPETPNFGFVVTHGDGDERRKIVVCTDFYEYAGVFDHFCDADFLFIEANHDLEMLRLRPNYASRYHMSNLKTARLLYNIATRGGANRPPKHVMLGHLSRQRNTADLAVGAVHAAFAERRIDIPFALDTAPAFEPSRLVQV
jgi:phosphoribosyl 1,2-cyclic phosphodiesterase